jgi:glycosyltransferase involved in cell wall biosynthesis
VQDLKISLITVTRNAEKTLSRCIESVIAQNYNNIEYIIIDGGSTDGTLQIINRYQQYITHVISEPDKGIYDAMNKGIKISSGNILGILNSDDFFTYKDIISCVAEAFSGQNVDALYGNLEYINPVGHVIRKWNSGPYTAGLFNRGWMPPHPTFYCKRLLFESLGLYDLEFGTAADYELMLRFIHLNNLKMYYLDKTMVKMTAGGVSNISFRNRLKAWFFDYKAMKKNAVSFPFACLVLKPMRKVIQFVQK